eukprot:GILK01009263.1.p1 GENE.GILK01009263.1~~GILK01009263.1.p1  ORF type:complete len:342 (+),score=21.17 GILK01009263.1:90-1028(+)
MANLSARDVLLQLPAAAYTCTRTYKKSSIVLWSFHIERLCHSCFVAWPEIASRFSAENTTAIDSLRSVLQPIATDAINMWNASLPHTSDDDAILTFILVPREPSDSGSPVFWNNHFNVYLHIATMKALDPFALIDVQVFGSPRDHPSAKLSSWLRQRRPLEEAKLTGVSEVLLASEEGEITEGLVSNFFVVIDGVVCTARVGILPGSTRHVVADLCSLHNIPIRFEAPSLATASSWQEAFISNVRGLSRVKSVWIGRQGENGHIVLPCPDNHPDTFPTVSVFDQLRRLLDENMSKYVEDLLPNKCTLFQYAK